MNLPQFQGRSLRIFLSYSTEDKISVGELSRELKYWGFETFMAHDDLTPATEWQEEIIGNLKQCDVFLPFLSKRRRALSLLLPIHLQRVC
jgi:hypothetical protein